MTPERPYKFTLSLTDKEDRLLTEFAKKQNLSRQKLIIQALRMYVAIDSGRAVLTPTDHPPTGAASPVTPDS